MPPTSPDHHDFLLRPMTSQDMEWALEMAGNEGWNPGLQDAAAFLAADPHGFFVGTFRGEPVSCIASVAYDQSFGFLGLYIVRKEFRGRGFGMQTWRKGMHYLGRRSIGLDGVVAQQANYRKSGFKLAYRNLRFEGVAAAGSANTRIETVDLKKVPWALLQAYDFDHFGAPREAFLRRWLEHAHVALGIMDGSSLSGYTVLRRCHKGYKFGPLFANSPDIAESLFQAACAKIGGETFYLDIPEPNAAGLQLAKRHDLKPVFETARMYTGEPPEIPLKHVFGVTTFELG